jgi:hypothetical protein
MANIFLLICGIRDVLYYFSCPQKHQFGEIHCCSDPKQLNPAIVSKKFTLDTIVHKSPALISPLCEQNDPFAVRQSASGTHKSMGEQKAQLFGFSGVDHELAFWRQSLLGTHVFRKVDHPGDLLASAGWMWERVEIKSTRELGIAQDLMKRTRAGNWKRINKTTRVEEGSRRISALRFSVAWATALGVVASAPEMEMGRLSR